MADAETVADGGWLMPGLVDVHTHPGAVQPGDPFDESVLRTDLAEHAAAGVLLIRAPGSAARIPAWAHDAEGLPRVRSAGPWLATPGRFFPSWGRHVTEADLPGAAAEEAAAAQEAVSRPEAAGPAGGQPGTGLGAASAPGAVPAAAAGWCKIIGDWAWDEPPVPLAVLRDVTSAVHALGGKVSVHCQTAAGCANAVAAGVDSLEHGMHLDPGLLDQMAAQGTALVPTLNAFAAAALPGPGLGSGAAPGLLPGRLGVHAIEGGRRARGGSHGAGRHRHAPLRDGGRGSGAADQRGPAPPGRGGRGQLDRPGLARPAGPDRRRPR